MVVSAGFFLSSFFAPLLLSVLAAALEVSGLEPVPDALLPVVLPEDGLEPLPVPVALEPLPVLGMPLPVLGALLLGVALLLLGAPMLLVSVELGVLVELVVVLGVELSGDFAGSLLPPQAVAMATSAPRAN